MTIFSVFLCTAWYLVPTFPQFSALYPEMVDAVVLLDSSGFLPTDVVFTVFSLRFYRAVIRCLVNGEETLKLCCKMSYLFQLGYRTVLPHVEDLLFQSFTIEAFFFFYRTMDAGFYFAFNTKLSAELPKFKNPKPSTDRSNSSGLFFGVLQTGKMHKEIEPCI